LWREAWEAVGEVVSGLLMVANPLTGRLFPCGHKSRQPKTQEKRRPPAPSRRRVYALGTRHTALETPMKYMKYLEEIEHYLEHELADQFEYAEEEQRYEILDFLEKLMDLGETADQKATELIFKNSYLQALAGVKTQQ
jgi:hypothetical protein